MMLYMRLGRLCALHAEWDLSLSPRPLFAAARAASGNETIIDMPWCRIIYTPADWNIYDHADPDPGRSCPAARDSGHRP